MECYNCGAQIRNEDKCPSCGCDLKAYRTFAGISDHLYNQGLSQARDRNLSDAIESLKLAIKYNKTNINARNLLGLVYYERGEGALAVQQWLISRGFQQEDNPATGFLKKTDSDIRERNRLSETAKKYNLVISQLGQGSFDLAAIQVKQVLSLTPNFVTARQIQGLLFLREGKFDAAIKTLLAASRTDTGDGTTQMYLREARMRKNRGRKKSDAYEIKKGNETIIQPRIGKAHSIINIILNFTIGIAMGAALVWFIAVPSMKRNITNEANAITVETQETLSTKNQQISALEDEITGLEGDLKKAKSANSDTKKMKEAYDTLIAAFKAYAENDLETATTTIQSVDRSLLTKDGKAAYDDLSENVVGTYLSQIYDDANYYYEGSNISAALEKYDTIVALDEDFDDGNALYNLAQCYRKLQDFDTAIKYYTRVTELFPDTEISENSEIYISQLQSYQ